MVPDFEQENIKKIKKMWKDTNFKNLSKKWFLDSFQHEYSYHFKWLGRPIIQYPQDMIAIQELIWKIKPDLIIETGIAHGGSLILSASILELIGKGEVIGIDIEIKKHNRMPMENHPLGKRIHMIEGSSISKSIRNKVYEFAKGKKRVMVILDSNHTHKHVLNELKLYSPLVTKGSYLVVMDTIIEYMPKSFFKNRPWGIGDNPMSAVKEFLKHNKRFKVDNIIEKKLVITVAPNGYLKCIKKS